MNPTIIHPFPTSEFNVDSIAFGITRKSYGIFQMPQRSAHFQLCAFRQNEPVGCLFHRFKWFARLGSYFVDSNYHQVFSIKGFWQIDEKLICFRSVNLTLF